MRTVTGHAADRSSEVCLPAIIDAAIDSIESTLVRHVASRHVSY